MPYEALRDALTNIAGDYLRRKTEEQRFEREQAAEQARFERTVKESDRQYLRGRRDLEADRAAETERAKDLARFNADLSLQTKLKELNELAPAQQESNLRIIGAAAGDMSVYEKDANGKFVVPLAELIKRSEGWKDTAATNEAMRALRVQVSLLKSKETGELTEAQQKQKDKELFQARQDVYASARSAVQQYSAALDEMMKADASGKLSALVNNTAMSLVGARIPKPKTREREIFLKNNNLPLTASDADIAAAIIYQDPYLPTQFQAVLEAGMKADKTLVGMASRVSAMGGIMAESVKRANDVQVNVFAPMEAQRWHYSVTGATPPASTDTGSVNYFNNAQSTQTPTEAPKEQKVTSSALAGALGGASNPATAVPAPGASNPTGTPGAVPAPVPAPAGSPAPAGLEVTPPTGAPSFFGRDRDPALNQRRVLDVVRYLPGTVAEIGSQVFSTPDRLGQGAMRFLSPGNWRAMNNGTIMYDPGYVPPAPVATDPAVELARRQLTPAYLRRLGPVTY